MHYRGELNIDEDDSMDKEEKRLKYLDQEKYDYIQNYIEQAREQTKDVDTHSVTTDTSDSGMPGSKNAPSEVGTEDISDPISNLCLKDLSKEVTAELACRLQVNPTVQQRFYQAFGLNPEKLFPSMLKKIAEFFPDTPVKLLKDVFQELQLYDLAELLEKVKSRELRPSLPLKEMKKLLNASGRPSKFYSKAEVLMIGYSDREAIAEVFNPDVERIGCFFQALNSRSQITKLTVNVAEQAGNALFLLKSRKAAKDHLDLRAKNKEVVLKEYLGSNESGYNVYHMMLRSKEYTDFPLTEEEYTELAALSDEDWRPAIKNLLQKVIEEREQRKLELGRIVKEIQQKEEEIKRHHQREEEKFQMAVSTVVDKWIHQAKDEDRESTLFVVLHLPDRWRGNELTEFLKTTRGCLMEKLALIPTTKLIMDDVIKKNTIIPQETLALRLSLEKKDLAIIQELLNKRWMTLDLLSILQEAQRTLLIKESSIPESAFYGDDFQYPWYTFPIYENLSCLPRLRKDEQKSESSDL